MEEQFVVLHLEDPGALAVPGVFDEELGVGRQVQRQAKWQPELLAEDGKPSFGLKFYIVDLQGRWAGVSLRGGGNFAVADGDGVRKEPLTVLHPKEK